VHVLLPLIHSHSVQAGAANARCKLEQSRAKPQCTIAHQLCQVSNTHRIISHRHRLFHTNFGGVPVAPDRPCRGQRAHKALSTLSPNSATIVASVDRLKP